jgi:ubiquinone/menaquinone biosynthesis C-methylase UbiE
MNLYSKYILPKFLDLTMKSSDMEKLRPSVIEGAHGVVLEIGFGSGLNLSLYQNVTKLYALEPSEELFTLGKDMISNTSFEVIHLNASAEEIPLPDESVDSVVSTWTFCTIPNPKKALSEIRRVLKPDGTFTFIEHGKSPSSGLSIIQHVLTPFSKVIAGGCHLNRDIKSIISSSGLQVKRLEEFEQKRKPLAHMYRGVAIK